MKNWFFPLYILAFLLVSCQGEEDEPFLISKTQVGFLTKNIQVKQLDSVFKGDSIVMRKTNGMFQNGNEIIIYDKDGKKLLLLDPVQSFDSTSTIGNIQILDPRFKTKEGFGVESTFKDIVANYSISRIENTLNALVIFIDEINAYVTIEKEDLPANLALSNDQNIKAAKIPEETPIKYFWIGWE